MKRDTNELGLNALVEISKALGDEARCRMLSLLRHSEMSVKDICDILDQSQPRVSRHLKILSDANLIERTKEGAWLYCRINTHGAIGTLLNSFFDSLNPSDPTLTLDMNRFNAIVSKRISDADLFFEANALEWDRIRALQIPDTKLDQEIRDLVGREKVENLLDVGTGTGQMLEALSGCYEKATGIDVSSAMLRVARGRLARISTENNIIFKQLNVSALNSEFGEFDCVICHHVLHFLENPEEAISRMADRVSTGGRLIIIDYLSHDVSFLVDEYHHFRQGFEPEDITKWLSAEGLSLQHMQSYKADNIRSKNQAGGLEIGLWISRKK